MFFLGDFSISIFKPHTCIEVGSKTRKPGGNCKVEHRNFFLPSAYTVDALAPVLSSLCAEGKRVTAVHANALLQEYVHEKPSAAFANKVKRAASNPGECDAVTVSYLRAYADLLVKGGHFAGVETVSGTEMIEVENLMSLSLFLFISHLIISATDRL